MTAHIQSMMFCPCFFRFPSVKSFFRSFKAALKPVRMKPRQILVSVSLLGLGSLLAVSYTAPSQWMTQSFLDAMENLPVTGTENNQDTALLEQNVAVLQKETEFVGFTVGMQLPLISAPADMDTSVSHISCLTRCQEYCSFPDDHYGKSDKRHPHIRRHNSSS